MREDHYELVCGILSKYLKFPDKVYAFGSRVKGTIKDSSDLDLVVKTENTKNILLLKEALEDSSLPYEVDILVYDNIPKEFQDTIDSYKIPFLYNWQTVKLGDVVTLKRGYDLPKNDIILGEYPVVASNGIIGYHNKFTTKAPFLSIGRSGSVGSPIFINQDCWAHNTCLYVKEINNVIMKYVYYLFKSLNLKNYAGGSAVPTLNRNHLTNIEIPLPPLEEQERIAEILSSFDDKIAINHKICTDLESMAQVLFRENFINNPARDTWGVVSLSDVADVRSSKRVFRDEYVPEGIPFYRGKEITELSNRQKISIPLFISYERYNELKSTSIIPQLGDILLTSVGTIGNVYLVDNSNPFYFKDGNITWIRDFSDNKLSKYILYWLTSSLGKKEIQAKLIGSTQQALTIDAIKTFNFSLPPQELLEKFENIVSPMYEQIKNLQKENIHLTETRDMLLPRLMKGEV